MSATQAAGEHGDMTGQTQRESGTVVAAGPVVPSRIDVRGVTKRYRRPGRGAGTFTALQDVSLSVREGEFVSLIGASGCGKTTLLRMMSGLIPVDSGQILVNGRLVNGVPQAIGFVFQEPALLPWRTVNDNLQFALKRLPLSAAEQAQRVADSLALTRLEQFASYYPRMLSGGMQQRVGLARALVGRPDVLFMDEPLSALDAFTRRRLQQDVSDIVAQTGATTVMVTHDVDEAIFFADRIIVMGSSPGTVKDVIGVDLPRPRRHTDVIGNETAAALRDRILSTVMQFS